MADAEPVRAGEVVRIRTTGGGGWGDPLDRPVADVLRDVLHGKVSESGAAEDYGVVVSPVDDGWAADEPATAAARAAMAAARPEREPFFDRGPGYARLSGGRTFAEVDFR
jgi:N-methylhydantoinase B